jgi:hypothetical protein
MTDPVIMAAEVEDALGRRIDFLIRSDVKAMKDIEAKNLSAAVIADYLKGVSKQAILMTGCDRTR